MKSIHHNSIIALFILFLLAIMFYASKSKINTSKNPTINLSTPLPKVETDVNKSILLIKKEEITIEEVVEALPLPLTRKELRHKIKQLRKERRQSDDPSEKRALRVQISDLKQQRRAIRLEKRQDRL